jgi:hypothetical protein
VRGATQTAGQSRVGMGLCSGAPLPDELAQRTEGFQLGRSHGDPRELVREGAPVDAGQELNPRQGFGERLVEGPAVVHSQVAEGASERCQRHRPFSLTVGSCQPEIRLVAAPEQDVTLVEVAGHLLRVSKKV